MYSSTDIKIFVDAAIDIIPLNIVEEQLLFLSEMNILINRLRI